MQGGHFAAWERRIPSALNQGLPSCHSTRASVAHGRSPVHYAALRSTAMDPAVTSDYNRRRFVSTAAMSVVAAPFSMLSCTQAEAGRARGATTSFGILKQIDAGV